MVSPQDFFHKIADHALTKEQEGKKRNRERDSTYGENLVFLKYCCDAEMFDLREQKKSYITSELAESN